MVRSERPRTRTGAVPAAASEGTKRFRAALADRQTDPRGRRWVFVPEDQLSESIGPLSREDPREVGIVVVESLARAKRRPYHRQKLAFAIANLRHFALEQAARGVAVRHEVTEGSCADALRPLASELGRLRMMEPAERELRVELAPLERCGALERVTHEGWLTTREEFGAVFSGGRGFRMDAFYRAVRARSGILMKDGRPVGGKWSFDAENRRPWKGEPRAPAPPVFGSDPVKEEVGDLVEERFADHPGRLALDTLPASAADAEALWSWAKRECLPHFGPYEDAMSTRSRGLFHTRISALLNVHRLLPARVVADVEGLDAPLASREGFIRQVLGWREFVRHVHAATDGFRELPDGARPPRAKRPGDAGYSRWLGKRFGAVAPPPGIDGGATPDLLEARLPLPAAFWGASSGLACLDRVVEDVLDEGFSHHITRLMVLSNLATLMGVSPRELTDWFWVAYVDAYDWVVEPNVLGMGTFALGTLFTTKPYVSGAAYLDRMSDYCSGCAFRPDRDCPVTSWYWDFLARHRERLEGNPRLAMPLRALAKRSEARRQADHERAERARRAIASGERLLPGGP